MKKRTQWPTIHLYKYTRYYYLLLFLLYSTTASQRRQRQQPRNPISTSDGVNASTAPPNPLRNSPRRGKREERDVNNPSRRVRHRDLKQMKQIAVLIFVPAP
ncbi:hypothetical protein F5884DRAFT_351755 [Xylogone sp. PMI_703]|nr:hypothetical protein F5884DRAFT_351755 [Xylogone sp. PMI_703]